MTKQILLSLLNCSWQWLLLSGLIWFVATRFRRSKTTVHLLWLLSLLSLPILFGLNQFVPALSIGGNPVPELAQAKPIDVSGLAALTTDLPEISPTQSDTQSKSQLLAESKLFTNWAKTDLLLCVWAIGALVMLVRFMFGLLRIHQLRRRAVVANDSYQSICRRLEQQLDINRRVTVCFSDRVASPISFGWLSPYILIPRKLDLEQFELVAAHELAHVQRHDWLTNLFSHLVGVVFFFHPIYYFLNRELVRLRERICDDWVIRLTGARKNYAQCLLDLVRHRDRAIPLALSLNQPSQLESRIDAILKDNRQLDVQLKPRLRLIAATLLLTCLPLLAMAQLVPLKTFQVSLFAQTPEKKKEMEKAKTRKMDGKEYKDESHIKVKDPTLLEQSEENRIFSGPQPSEKLPPLTVTGIGGKIDGTTFDITTKADGKPLILFLQDTNAVGVKGLVNVSKLLLKIDAFQKRHSKATGAEKSNQGIQIGVVFLADSLDTLPDWAHDMLNEEIPNEILTGISPEGREGPGSYGLNRNVAQTVIVAKDGKVLYNFAFTQPMLYTDPHLLGVIAQAIEVESATLEKWLNEESVNRRPEKKVKAVIIKKSDGTSGDAHDWVELRNPTDTELNLKGWKLYLATTELDTERRLIRFNEDVKIPANGYLILDAESLKKLGITLEEDEKLLNKTKATPEKKDRVEKAIETQIDKLLENVKLIEELLNETKAIYQKKDMGEKSSEAQIKQLEVIMEGVRIIEELLNKAKATYQKKDMDAAQAAKLHEIIVLTAKFLEDLRLVKEFINEMKATAEEKAKKQHQNRHQAADEERMQRDRRRMGREGARNSEQDPSREELVKRFDKDGDGKLNEEEGMAARRALVANRESQNRSRSGNVEVKNPAEFKKEQGATIFSGPQPGEKLPPLMAKGINGETKGKMYDVIAKADGQPLVIFLQDERGLGLRGLLGISRLLAQIAEKSEQKMLMSAVFLGDAPDTLENQASKLVSHIPSGVLLGISQEGREGPGSYGLNRNVAQTVIIAKDGKVLHNFAFAQPMLRPDPYVLGAVGEAVGIKPATLEKWLNEKPAEGERMEGSREQMRRGEDSDEVAALRERLRLLREKHEAAHKQYEEIIRKLKQRGK